MPINNYITMHIKTALLLSTILITLFAQTCPTSYFFNGQRCAPCRANCQCTTQDTCSSCLSGYTYDALFENCLQCPTATDAVNIGCSQCCYQVQGPGFVCSSCAAQSYVFQTGGQCFKLNGCLVLSQSGMCTSCASGFFLSQGACTACDSSCATCHDSSLCLTCNTGYFNGTDVNNALCQSCATGCTACTSAGATCSACMSGYRLDTGSCVACPSNCLTCSASTCMTCDSSSALVGISCQLCTHVGSQGSAGCTACTSDLSRLYCSACSDGYYLDSSTQACVLCTSRDAHSTLCNATHIIQCQDDSHATVSSRYYLVDNTCVANTNNCKDMSDSTGRCSACYFTTSAYYSLSASGVCNLCNVAGCATYSSTCVCLSCQDGYQFINNNCVACQNLHCHRCQASTSACEACAPSYGRESSACQLCTPSNCNNCDGDRTICITCDTGYYLSSGNCYKCQTNCLTCQSNIQCTSCNTGHFLQANGRCKQLPSNCIDIDTTTLDSQVGSCKRCSYGYMLLDGNCYPCSNSLFNLMLCNDRFCPNYYLTLGNWQNHPALVLLICALMLIALS